MCERCEVLEEALRRIMQWSEAYPTNVFREPTTEEYKRAHKLLVAQGMSINIFSASMGRHCLQGIGEIARGALDS
jgi:hypothetical protein